MDVHDERPSLSVDQIARVCHAANQELCRIFGDPVARDWDEFSEGERHGVMRGVQAALEGESAEDLHDLWMMTRLQDGWKYGDVLDREAKIHPNLAPYDKLPPAQKLKDYLFTGIVKALE
jgi:hypothetical protein